MRALTWVTVAAGGLTLAGCGEPESKVAGKPSADMIAADKAAQKTVEDEERGTPIKAKGKK